MKDARRIQITQINQYAHVYKEKVFACTEILIKVLTKTECCLSPVLIKYADFKPLFIKVLREQTAK